MDNFAFATDLLQGLFSYGLPFLFVLSCVIIVHEWGHYQVARWCGVRVEVFSIGFGPEIAHYTDRSGTRWRIAALPLGGYVRFFGDRNAASAPDHQEIEQMSEADRRVSFTHKSLAQRSAVIAAGPITNFLFTILIFTLLFSFYGRTLVSPQIGTVMPDSPAAAAGLQPGDLIRSVDDTKIDDFGQLAQIIMTAKPPLNLEILRDERLLNMTLIPEIITTTDAFGNQITAPRIGITNQPSPENLTTIRYNPLQALGRATLETFMILKQIIGVISDIIYGGGDAKQLGGPIMIAKISGQAADIGFIALIHLAALLSVSIGFINLLPIPLFDGGHLLYNAYEAIFRKPLPIFVQETGFKIGFALILFLMLFVTFNDLTTLGLF